jgi:flavorubredoxin/flavin reductase (DIM6/NTAB) family NADH-FMN oxidoreductase RutF
MRVRVPLRVPARPARAPARRILARPTRADPPAAPTRAPPTVAVTPVTPSSIGGAPGIIRLAGACDAPARVGVEYKRGRGTTDAAHLLADGPLHSVLIDVPDEAFAATFPAAVAAATPGGGPLPPTLVLTHLTPARLPTLKALLQARVAAADEGGAAPAPLDVYVSTLALRLLRETLGPAPGDAALLAGVTLHAAKPGTAVGRGGRLALVPAPTPRWPDLLLAHDAPTRTLFSSKFFSAHISPAVAAKDGAAAATELAADREHFFSCTLAPVARQARSVLDRLDIRSTDAGGGSAGWLRSLDAALADAQRARFGARDVGSSRAPGGELAVAAVLPLHGPPAVGAEAAAAVADYRRWTAAAAAAADALSVAVFHASAYGNTASLAQGIARGATRAGVGVEAIDLETAAPDAVRAALTRAAGFAVGSPTLGGHLPTQVVTALGVMLREPTRGAPVGVFGSYGWSGEAVDDLATRLADAGYRPAFLPLRVKFRPTAADMAAAEAAGEALGAAVKRGAAKRAAAAAADGAGAAGATAAEAAVGRIVGSLCVITAAGEPGGGAATAMLASWVSQASFNPPGLTFAVARERAAAGTLLLRGARCVVNVLAEGREGAVSRALAKAAPGGDRLAGLGAAPEPETGAMLLPADLLASHLVCTVVSTADAGDHAVVYCTVDGGAAAPGGPNSAVRLRKTGAAY